jgi:Ala-tRNA(Pro) deacylase
MFDKIAFLAFLDSRKIPFSCEDHPPVFNMSDSENLSLSIHGVHCKNLLLKNKTGDYFLVVTTATKSLDLTSAAVILESKRLSFASADSLYGLLGVRPGALSPFALVNDAERKVRLVMDLELADELAFIFHPIENNASISISRVGLDMYLSDIGREATWLAFSGRKIG